MAFVAVKALGGMNYVIAEEVIAVQMAPAGGSIVVMKTGTQVTSTEVAKQIAERIEAVMRGETPTSPDAPKPRPKAAEPVED